MTKPKVLVTGGSGYIGTNLIPFLQGYEVHVLDLIPPRVSVDQFFLQNICDQKPPAHHYHTVVHLAALVKVGDSILQELDYWRVNVGGTLNLIDNLYYDNFIFASTSQAGTHNPYSHTKLIGEHLVKNTPNHSILRFSNVLGGVNLTNEQSILANLNHHTFRVFGRDWNTPDGTAVRDYIGVGDIVTHILKRIDTPSEAIEILGSGVGCSVLEMIEINRRVTGFPKEVVFNTRRMGDIEDNVVTPSPTFVVTKTIEEILHEYSTGVRPTP